MSDPYRDPARGPYVRERTNTMGWALGILAALFLIGLSYWGVNRNGGTTNTANRSTVPVQPAAIPGRASPPLQETTGQGAPSR
jgi:hypothetical protein